jgi:multiple sugar transport system permease protein
MSPTLAGFALGFVGPILAIFAMSATDWNLINEVQWVGTKNFDNLFGSTEFGLSLWATLKIATLTTIFQLLGGALLGYALSTWGPASRWLSAIYLLPWMAAPIAIGVIWKWLLAPTGGLFSQLLGLRLDILTNPTTAPIVIAAVAAWAGTGFAALVFASGLRSVPKNTVGAAKIDGANAWQVFWQIQVPQMRRIILFLIITIALQSLSIYDLVYVLTGGGPSQITDVATMHIVERALKTFEVGMASAMSIVFAVFELLVIGVVWAVYLRLSRRFDD